MPRLLFGVFVTLALAFPSVPRAAGLGLEEIFVDAAFDGPTRPTLTWIEGGRALLRADTVDSSKVWTRLDPVGGEESVWLRLGRLPSGEAGAALPGALLVSPQNDDFVVVATRSEARWRRSAIADHFVVERTTGRVRPLGEAGREVHPVLAPDGASVAYVHDGDLYVQDFADASTTRLTERESGEITHGDPDWVSEEEFDLHEAFWWSPRSTHLAWLRFDRTGVERYPLVHTGDGAMPQARPFDYPKAGARNSAVDLFLHDRTTGRTTRVAGVTSDEGYLVRAHWSPDGRTLLYEQLDRDQRRLRLFAVDLGDPRSAPRLVLEEREDAWVEVDDDLHFVDDASFTWTSRRDGYRHLYVGHLDGRPLEQLTQGAWEVREVLAATADRVWLLTHRTRPVDRNLERFDLPTRALVPVGPSYGWSAADVAPDARALVHTWSAADERGRMEVLDVEGKALRTLVDDRMEDLRDRAIGRTEILQIPIDGAPAPWATILRPDDFDATRRHPVLVHVYGGPGAQLARDAWGGRRGLFHRRLVQQGWVVVIADGRGAGARGRDHEAALSRALGTAEIDDQLAVIDHLRTQAWVDPERIAIWGASYGGYASAATLLRSQGRVAAAIAVAPVTDWRFYDTAYTERYLGTPTDEAVAYERGSLLPLADRLEGALLLVHGTGDDNVHVQNTHRLAAALVQAGRPFELMIYPDQNHGMRDRRVQLDLYRRIEDFLRRRVTSGAAGAP